MIQSVMLGGNEERNQGTGDISAGLWSVNRSFPERNVWERVGEKELQVEVTAWTQGLSICKNNHLSEFKEVSCKLTFTEHWDDKEEVRAPALPLTGCAPSDKLCHQLGLQFSHL